ncbi:MAG: DUF2889 domain-containing protein [Novosphingobium sp.]|nr:MAG: DUF2889 domain-containing protein [Novosphingobium sp.]
MASKVLPPPPRATANPAPARASSSVRRTSSIDVTWPEGEDGDRLFVGRARDFFTPAGGGAKTSGGRVLEEAGYRATLAQDKTITSIVGEPYDSRLDSLVGVRGGNHLRLFIKETMPELIATGAPLYLPLDDISGTALVSAFAWSQWHDDWQARLRERMGHEEMDKMMAARVNVCWGLQEGHSGVDPDGPPRNVADADAGDVRNPHDPEGWHPLHDVDGPGFRRARRIDVTRDASGLIRIDAAFQDSAKRKDGTRVAIHEYNIVATADPATLEILTLEPEARILPFSECPGAIHNARRLIGSRIAEVRDTVLGQLRGPEGCTHLNDALRALAEVPKLAEDLARAEA